MYPKHLQTTKSPTHIVRISLRPLSPAVWLSYTLFTSAGGKFRIIYSARITKHAFRCRERECVTLPDIAPGKASAKRIFRLLVKGRVTPFSADEVMESILETVSASESGSFLFCTKREKSGIV